jgi:peptide chain release factor 1
VSSYNLPGVLGGDIDLFIDELAQRDEADRLSTSSIDDED